MFMHEELNWQDEVDLSESGRDDVVLQYAASIVMEL